MSSPFFVKLRDRGAVLVNGPDAQVFLQGLITNDMSLLDSQACVYSCLLTPQGKFLYDFFLTKQEDAIQLECEGGIRATTLMTRLNHFKLRSKVTLKAIEDINVFQIIAPDMPPGAFPDPRHPGMGFRSYQRPDNIPEYGFDEWDRHRILLRVPDGSRDLKIDHATLAEGNIEALNGVSYTKGCYMGQELTARVHHRGLSKRHLITLHSEGNPFPLYGADIKSGATLIGEMRSSCGNVGLAVVKDDAAALLKDIGYGPHPL